MGVASGVGLDFTIYTEKHGVALYSEADARRELGMDAAQGGAAGATGLGDGSVRLRLVVDYCLYEHFEAMASADVVVLSRGPHGSLSDMVSQLTLLSIHTPVVMYATPLHGNLTHPRPHQLGYFAKGVVLLHTEERMLRYTPLPLRWHSASELGVFNESAVAASLAAPRRGRRGA